MGKPMVVDEFNRKRPVSARNAFLSQAYQMFNAPGSPVVGKNVWLPSSSTYPDYGEVPVLCWAYVKIALLLLGLAQQPA